MRRKGSNAEPPAPDAGELLSTGQVARLFGVSTSAVTRWARLGALRSMRTAGGHYRFRASDVDRAALAPHDLLRLD